VGETFHSRWLGLFREPRKRGQQLPVPRNSAFLLLTGTSPNARPLQKKSEQLDNHLGWVYAAVTLIAQDVRSNPWTLFEKTGRDRNDWQAVEDHPLLRVLARPNDLMTWGDLVEVTQTHLDLTGEAYWHVITNGRGTPVGLEAINPRDVQEPVVREGRFVGWRVQVTGHPQRIIPRDDVVFLRYPHPLSTLRGASPVEAFAVSHELDLYARAYGANLVKNDGGVPIGLLSSDQELTDEQADAIREGWKDRYGRTQGEVAVVGKGARYQPIGVPLGDLQFLQLSRFSRDQVLGIYRVPSAKLGLVDDFNRANADAADDTYNRNCLLPRLHRLEEALNARVLPRFLGRDASGYYLELKSPVTEDQEFVLRKAVQGLRSGSLTVNQHREMLGLDPMPDGNVYLRPVNVVVVPAGQGNRPTSPQDENPTGEDEDENERLVRENRELRVALAERKHYQRLRGYFARSYHELKDEHEFTLTGQPIALIHDPDELQGMGVSLPDERLIWRNGETVVQHFERLKSTVAKELARELAEREES
jgi:HK97 family phage portal protein